MSKPILQVQELQIAFETKAGRLQAIRGVEFQLERGKTLAIVGESGSGKSVTVPAIMGIRSRNQRASGRILFRCGPEEQEYEILSMRKQDVVTQLCGKHIAMVFQDPMTTLNPTMTIGKQVMEGMRRHRKLSRAQAWQEAVSLLGEVGITNPGERMRQYPHQLSGGMRQRVVIAIALACEPELQT